MAEPKRMIRTSAVEITDALAVLELDVEIIRTALLVGEAERDGRTALDPPIIAPIISWGGIVRSLRERLIPRGWRLDDRGLSLIINPSGTIAIAVKTGDEFTGIASGTPRTKRPIGPAAVAVVERNRRQLELFKSRIARAVENECATWFLLRRRYSNQVFAELALPAAISFDGNIDDWAERIIFDPIPLDPGSTPLLPRGGGGDDGDGGVEFDVSVNRR
jgi:hypothetical protein